MKIKVILFPIAWIYGTIAAIRRKLYRKNILYSYTPDIFTVGVGNLAVGGTGKTPHVEYIVRLLSKDYETATLSRGYRRKTKGFVVANDYDNRQLSANIIGDEPLQFHSKFPQIKVAVDENRAHGIQQLVKIFPSLQCVILDDCYQHVAVNPHVKVLITEYRHPYCSDYPIPMGRLRERKSAAQFADIIIVSKCPSELTENDCLHFTERLQAKPFQSVFFSTMLYGNLHALTEKAKHISVHEQSEVIVITGIAHHQVLIDHLSGKYRILHHYSFPDHHYYSAKEIQEIKKTYFSGNQTNRIIITTEKDSMRLIYGENASLIQDLPLFSIPIEPEFLFNRGEDFNRLIRKKMLILHTDSKQDLC